MILDAQSSQETSNFHPKVQQSPIFKVFNKYLGLFQSLSHLVAALHLDLNLTKNEKNLFGSSLVT